MSNTGSMAKRRPSGFAEKLDTWASRVSFSWKVREALYRHIASKVANDVPLDKALDTFRERLQRRKQFNTDRIIEDVSRKMHDGATLASAFGDWIPLDEASGIQSGEMSGNLPRALNLLVESKRRIARVNGAIKSALTDPIIYAIAILGTIWTIGRYVVPGIEQSLPIERASGAVYALYVMGDFVNSYWVLLPLVLIAIACFLVVRSFTRWTGPARIRAERFFPYSFYRDSQGYVWLMSFAALLRANVVDTKILQNQMATANPWMRERLHAIWWRMDNGASLSAALLAEGKNGMPPFGFPNPNIVDDISSLAGFADFPEKISILATQWAEEMEQSVLDGAKKFGAMMNILMYAIIGFVIVAANTMSSQLGAVPGL